MAESMSWHTDDELRESYIRLCDRIASADDSLRVFVPGTQSKNQVLAKSSTITKVRKDGYEACHDVRK